MNAIDIIIRAKDMASNVMDGVSKSTNKLKASFASAVDASQKAALGLVAVGTAAAGFIGYGAKVAADLESSRQGFITLLGSAKKADETIALIKKDAAATPFELPGLISANQMLTSVTKNGVQSEKILMNVGKALAAMGKGQPELDRIIVNLQQIGAVGHASMIDIKQFAFAGIPIFDMLAKSTGKTGEALSDFISEGGVTFEMLTDMFNKAGSAGGQFANAFTNQAGTFNQLMSNMKDTIAITAAEVIQSTGIFEGLKGALASVINYLSANKENIVSGIKNFMELIKNNAPVVAGILAGILAPAAISAALAIGKMTLTLAPWAIAGALIALVVSKIVQKMGGWQAALKKVQPALDFVKNAAQGLFEIIRLLITGDFRGGIFGLQEDSPFINALFIARDIALKLADVFKKAFGGLWATIKKDLLPALARLWPLLKVILIAVGVLLGASLAIFIASIWVAVKALTFAVKIISAVINFLADVGRVGWAVMQGIWNVVTTVWNAIWTVIKFVLDLVIGYLRFMFAIYSAIWNGIVAIVQFVWNIIWTIVQTYINIIIGVIKGLIAVVGYIMAVIRGLFIVAWQWIYNVAIKPVIDKIAAIMRWLWNNVISPVWNAIKTGVQSVWNVISSVFNAIRSFVSSVFNSVRNFASSAWGGVKGIWSGAVSWFRNIFGSIGKAASGIKDGIVNSVTGAFETAKNTVKSGINWMIDKINGIIRGVNNSAGKLPGVPNIPEIPKLNTGVENFRGGLAYVHQGEVLTNLPKGTNVIPKQQVDSMGGVGGIHIENIHLNSAGAVDRMMEILDRRGELSSLGVPT
jgi:tape measure domain-containing protein